MLIYLDANIAQYCADYDDFIFGGLAQCPVTEPKLRQELTALKELVKLEQLGSDWVFAAPDHLIQELRGGNPSGNQLEVYRVLREAYENSGWLEEGLPHEDDINRVEISLEFLNLKQAADRRHLAEAVALGASWFLTNDREVIKKVREVLGGNIQHTRVCRPSECLEEISIGLFLR